MIETLRLGTRVVTGNPVWPHIRKIAHTHTHTRYVFTRAGQVSVTAEVSKSEDPAVPTVLTLPRQGVGLDGAERAWTLTDAEIGAAVEHLRADLAADGLPSPVEVRLLRGSIGAAATSRTSGGDRWARKEHAALPHPMI